MSNVKICNRKHTVEGGGGGTDPLKPLVHTSSTLPNAPFIIYQTQFPKRPLFIPTGLVSTFGIRIPQENKDWLAPSLRLFMEHLISTPLQQATIGQTITHAVKPKSSIPPILFGCAVEMDHVFGSRWLLTELTRYGF